MTKTFKDLVQVLRDNPTAFILEQGGVEWFVVKEDPDVRMWTDADNADGGKAFEEWTDANYLFGSYDLYPTEADDPDPELPKGFRNSPFGILAHALAISQGRGFGLA